MMDLISRQKAIDALMDALNDVGVLDAEDINTVFQMLLSAQLINQDSIETQSSDLISRQAVLGIAFKYCPDDDGTCSEAGTDLRDMLDELENLPSAQPEPHWIPITEQLPEPYEDVLLTCMDEVTIGWHYTGVGTGWAIYEGEKSVDENEVKAWMPLPEPYMEVTT